jgi:hypothetical protein
VFDRPVPLAVAEREAAQRAAGARIFVIAPALPPTPFPDGYHLIAVHRYAGIEQLLVSVWSRSATAAP